MQENFLYKLNDVVSAEPRLQACLDMAAAARHKSVGHRMETYSIIKNIALPLVGYFAEDPRLQNHVAWDSVMHKIIDILEI